MKDIPTLKDMRFISGNAYATDNESIGTWFYQVIPNSHYFTELGQILLCIKMNMDQEYIIIGLQNSIKMGYDIAKIVNH
jgi:hypothetical protein